MDTITTSTPVVLDEKERSLIIAHRQAIAAERNGVEGPKLSPEQLRENYLVYHRKAYDKRRDKVLAHRKACYVPTGRPIGKPRKSRETIILNKELVGAAYKLNAVPGLHNENSAHDVM